MEKILVEYSSNNSGGDWWLTEQDWLNLEKAGWVVVWQDWLGSKAKRAFYLCNTLKEAVANWEAITSKDSKDEGCPCCGNPHDFYTVSKDSFKRTLKWFPQEGINIDKLTQLEAEWDRANTVEKQTSNDNS